MPGGRTPASRARSDRAKNISAAAVAGRPYGANSSSVSAMRERFADWERELLSGSDTG
ncbi:hypothetical protein [Microbispora sp. H10836]|uniref:hypothetical protein n=1 Tax=Microbispora sp. H10836 TaxID=2729106 RepID=UPI0014738523|nr:hypothetical protein [Microbispora sp. H10836]